VSYVQQNDQITRKWALPKQDVNAPDLYIPLMSFFTYVLLYGLSKGLGSAEFSPDTIIQAIWRCLALQTLESCLIKFGTNMLSAPVPFLDVIAYSGYKYVPLCVNSLLKMINGTIGMIVALVTACMLAYFVLKSMAAAIPPSAASGSAQESTRLILLPGIGGVQLLLVLILSLF
jgi:protein transport protein YIF1